MTDYEIKELFKSSGITETGTVTAEKGNEFIIRTKSEFSPKRMISSIEEIMEGAKSIIVFLVPYNNGAEPLNLSLYATGRDYHKVCTEISEKISHKLTDSGYKSVSFADAGPLSERRLAQAAGLGIIGDSGFLINEKYGTYTFIGYIITNCPLTPAEPSIGECVKCGKCFTHCPGKALTPTGFCTDKCISFITQKKGSLTEIESELIKKGGSVWGCDICQRVCPMNKGKSLSPLPDFNENLILCINYEYLSNNQFRVKHKDRAFTWRGKSVIDRNLSILTDNSE